MTVTAASSSFGSSGCSSRNCGDAENKTSGFKRPRDDSDEEERQASTGCEQKRPTPADSFARVAKSGNPSQTSGRGSVAGWTLCPLCGRHSRKLFALGRGIAAHLHAVHTPWKPGKVERQKRRRLKERRQREMQQKQRKIGQDLASTTATTDEDGSAPAADETWEPSEDEVQAWNAQIMQIVKDLDEKRGDNLHLEDQSHTMSETSSHSQAKDRLVGVDRNGKEAKPYRASLPSFIQAAANGKIVCLKELVHQVADKSKKEVWNLINARDRHLSTAEHWAAGGGHLAALKYLLELRKQYTTSPIMDIACQTTHQNLNTSQDITNDGNKSQPNIRRRDGKTALHYAARNGHVECINYLVQQEEYAVDEVSGDGTTAFHLACFGGHLEAMKTLWQQHGADPCKLNDFDCSAAHWTGITRCECPGTVRSICQLLQSAGVSFVQRQKQGHTSLHKAAQRKNRHVILWLSQDKGEGGAGLSREEKIVAGQPDDGGHIPSEIWRSVGGDNEFADWMKCNMGW